MVRRARRGGLRATDVLLALVILALLALLAHRLAGPGTVLSGVARIADGDTLTLDGERIRLFGIDAPEFAQSCTRGGASYACGRAARDRLSALAGAGTITCAGRGRDRYGRLLARCSAAGTDLGAAMVEEGWAVAYGDYGAAEARARAARRGLWDGTFEPPRAWREMHGGLAEGEHAEGLLRRLIAWLAGAR